MAGGWPDDLVEQLAAAYHDLYRSTSPDDPAAALAWDDLPANLQESNRDTARALPAYLAAMGLTIRPATGPVRPVVLPRAGVELAARAEHERWVTERGGTTDPSDPDLADWNDLDDTAQEKDRIRITAAPTLLARLGVEIVPRPRD